MFLLLNVTEHETSTVIKQKYIKIYILALKPSDVVFIMLINVKLPIYAGIFNIFSRINCMFN